MHAMKILRKEMKSSSSIYQKSEEEVVALKQQKSPTIKKLQTMKTFEGLNSGLF